VSACVHSGREGILSPSVRIYAQYLIFFIENFFISHVDDAVIYTVNMLLYFHVFSHVYTMGLKIDQC